MNRKHGLLLFLCACIPGCGQMYQGYMRRGVSLLGLGCVVIALASILSLGELAIFLPLLWIYAFFDTYNLRSQMDAGIFPEDDFLFGLGEMDSRRLEQLLRTRHSLIGWVLVAVGLYALWQTVVGGILRELLQNLNLWWVYDILFYSLPRVVVMIAIILLGVWFIRGPRGQEEPEEDYTYVPPAQDASAAQTPLEEDDIIHRTVQGEGRQDQENAL